MGLEVEAFACSTQPHESRGEARHCKRYGPGQDVGEDPVLHHSMLAMHTREFDAFMLSQNSQGAVRLALLYPASLRCCRSDVMKPIDTDAPEPVN